MKKYRLIITANGVFTGVRHKEMRGGKQQRPDFERKQTGVKTFISSLCVNESHYSCAKIKRLYLSSELNRLYNKKVDDEIKLCITFKKMCELTRCFKILMCGSVLVL